MKPSKIGLLPRVLIAIIVGVLCGMFFPEWAVRCFITFNSIFSHFLSFLIPLIIVGLVTSAIADIGKGAGKLLLITTLIAYGDTALSGFLSYFTSAGIFPSLIEPGRAAQAVSAAEELQPFFTIEIPPLLDVMSALITAFVLGLGISFFESSTLKKAFDEFREIIAKTIEVALIPILPIYIFSIFLNMSYSGQAWHIINVFVAIIGIIFLMHIFLLVFQYCLAGMIAHRNPFRALYNMLPAYFTALGTSSSAATIPVTLKQVKKNGVSDGIGGFVVPLCATIHLSGSAMKITACAVALLIMQGGAIDFAQFAGFILMLGVMMVAAPGVPGGAIMAALGVLQSILGFTAEQQAVMIALYITMDSFGTACNVTGDGAIALVVDRIYGKRAKPDLS
ncbi:MAG: dicarboxylate/amino acid:cation symporter [Muribaculaceae bacterium]|nr:dicarboxylate/amino acid:cation symporter [Muribaculaceae bacterium]MBQ9821091.1 dicarboxylate/amino acid:cation symporter [Muribaculaceae bacterium]